MSYQYQQAVKELLPPPEQIKYLMEKDKPLMVQFGICIQAVKNNPRYNDKINQFGGLHHALFNARYRPDFAGQSDLTTECGFRVKGQIEG